MSESVSERMPSSGRVAWIVAWVRARDLVDWTLIVLFAISLVLHLWNVGARAYHHDESQHAAYSYYYATGGGYAHNPLLHGPLQFHVIAVIFKVFGDSDVTARVYQAVMGSVLILTPLLVRRTLGNAGTIVAAVLLLLSPSLLYYSRFARNELSVAVFTVMMFAGAWRYRSDRRLRWLLVLSAGLSLSFSSKETSYISSAVLLLYLNAALAHALFWDARRGESVSLLRRAARGVWLLPTAWVFAALWGPLAGVRARLGFRERPPEADTLLVVGTLVLPELAALSRIPIQRLGLEAQEMTIGILVVVALLVGSILVGWAWRWSWWLACAAVFFAISVPLYASMGTHVEGVGGLFWNSLSYWLDQQGVRRGTQPWFYYFMMTPLYESLALLPALAGGTWLALRRGDHFASMCLGWFAGTFVALSIAGEKMPWLTVHIALPLAILAAYVLGKAIPAAWSHLRAGDGPIVAWGASGLAAAVLAIALVVTVRADIGLNVWHPDTPIEPMIYVQSTTEIAPLADEMRAWIADGRASTIVLDDTQDTGACGEESCGITWPWAWYLRHSGIVYAVAGQVDRAEVDPRAIVIRPRGIVPASPALANRSSDVVVYRHRWWYPEENYRETTWKQLLTGALISDWARFVWDRGDLEQVSSLDGEIYFPK